MVLRGDGRMAILPELKLIYTRPRVEQANIDSAAENYAQ